MKKHVSTINSTKYTKAYLRSSSIGVTSLYVTRITASKNYNNTMKNEFVIVAMIKIISYTYGVVELGYGAGTAPLE